VIISIAGCLVGLAASASVHSGCGFDALGTAAPDGSLPDATVETGAAVGDGGGDFDSDASQQEECTAPRSVCGTTCTDTTADPDNCGACGTKCEPGQTCESSKCEILCIGDTLRCSGACIDPKSDTAHCGSCTNACGLGKVCVEGSCTTDCGLLQRCTAPDGGLDASLVDYCADLTKDRNNCGMCGRKCAANETCSAGTCTALCVGGSRIGDELSSDMVGCAGRVTYGNRATLCPAGTTVCGAAQWVARRAGKKPTFNYWTEEYLLWTGQNQNCAAVTNGNGCNGTPMRVCAANTDPLGNRCNWTNCGLGGTSPNQYFGGCQDNPYAGTLCCKP
jgi:hypothetical protein